MSFRYNTITRAGRIAYRKLFPVPTSPYTLGEVKDICSVNLVPPEKLIAFFTDCLGKLKKIKGNEVGDYFEFGVFNGNSIGSMHVARKDMGLSSMRLFGFDAFQDCPRAPRKEMRGHFREDFILALSSKRRSVFPEGI